MMAAHWRPRDSRTEIMDMIRTLLWKKRIRSDGGDAAVTQSLPPAPPPVHSGAGLLKAIEKRQILDAMAACDSNTVRAAEMLGIHRTTLWRKLKRLGIDTR